MVVSGAYEAGERSSFRKYVHGSGDVACADTVERCHVGAVCDWGTLRTQYHTVGNMEKPEQRGFDGYAPGCVFGKHGVVVNLRICCRDCANDDHYAVCREYRAHHRLAVAEV